MMDGHFDRDRETVLVVDDTPTNLSLLNGLLREHYRVKVANSGQKALELAQAQPPDLILLDIMMPEMDGYEVCRRLKSTPSLARAPVIFLTAKVDPVDEEMGFAVGAVDFIHKPISPSVVLARVRTHLENQKWRNFLEDKNTWLEREVESRADQVNRLQDASLQAMIELAEFRDECTGNHIRRTQEYVRVLAEHIAPREQHRHILRPDAIRSIVKSAPLHDIGKICIPDHILLKRGPLDEDEFAIMRTHAMRGYDILAQIRRHLGEDTDYLLYAQQIARHHHEKWDGSGYPDKLAGTAIPLAARLMALADVYDALRTRRPYKVPMDHEAALGHILMGREKHFDPELVDALVTTADIFQDIARQLPD